MHLVRSCDASPALLHCNILTYVVPRRLARPQRVNLEFEEITMLLSLIRMIQAFRDYQRNVSELSKLTDRELADIGLDRSDIPRVSAGNYKG